LIPSRKARRYPLYILGAVVAIVVIALVQFRVIEWLRNNSGAKPTGVVAGSFRRDFQRPTPKAGWRYLWNANGDLGAAANYADLQWSETPEPMYVPNAQGPRPNPPPASFLRVTAQGGHPGHGPWQTRLPHEFYTIYAFAIPERGTYRLANSSLARI